MAFDISTAKPATQGFDINTAKEDQTNGDSRSINANLRSIPSTDSLA